MLPSSTLFTVDSLPLILFISCYDECRYPGCRYAEYSYAECSYADCRYAECRYAECSYVECRGASSAIKYYLLF